VNVDASQTRPDPRLAGAAPVPRTPGRESAARTADVQPGRK